MTKLPTPKRRTSLRRISRGKRPYSQQPAFHISWNPVDPIRGRAGHFGARRDAGHTSTGYGSRVRRESRPLVVPQLCELLADQSTVWIARWPELVFMGRGLLMWIVSVLQCSVKLSLNMPLPRWFVRVAVSSRSFQTCIAFSNWLESII